MLTAMLGLALSLKLGFLAVLLITRNTSQSHQVNTEAGSIVNSGEFG